MHHKHTHTRASARTHTHIAIRIKIVTIYCDQYNRRGNFVAPYFAPHTSTYNSLITEYSKYSVINK